ncbi:TDT family transporter [Sutterella sp.]|uniref:TDT family transporter n=1 Tax=Sutterella sp. TaxID=1981025 RepID=UPI0026DF37DA|nr:TDT family transporter [Sutterella sp.]MDO5532209.1 TDT family transporter [Sutterella sp.]
MLKALPARFRGLPTPMAGLALGIASLGWGLENALPLHGWGQITGAAIASVLLCLLIVRFALNFGTLWADLKHPVVGSIVPTFAMAMMVISRALLERFPTFAVDLWCFAVVFHLLALAAFIWFRMKETVLPNMVPSWFVPPVGIIVADVSFPGVPELLPVAQVLLVVGIAAYAVLLPVMLYRLFFLPQVANAAKPTMAIMAAPASLSLAGYLSVSNDPHLLLVALLFGIAILMTVAIYFAFWHLLRLQFSPGYAAFTFPMAIGATALYKLANLVATYPGTEQYVSQLRILAHFEIAVATVVIAYVFILYMKNLKAFFGFK